MDFQHQNGLCEYLQQNMKIQHELLPVLYTTMKLNIHFYKYCRFFNVQSSVLNKYHWKCLLYSSATMPWKLNFCISDENKFQIQ